MNDKSAFVSELLRAANDVERLGPPEVRRLLHRAIVCIRDQREFVGIAGSGTPSDEIIVLMNVATRAERFTRSDWARALLDAAEMIRALRIVADTQAKTMIRDAS